MAIRFEKYFLVAIAIAALVQCSTAQTRHVVGDSLGWIVPPNGASTYSNWAANKTFTVGDILVFNFATGSHDVTQVTQSSYNACNTANPLSKITNAPANITLNATGPHYYICSFPGHCLGGQKLAINVSASASSPAPQPSSPVSPPTPTPTPTPTPIPASAPTPTPTSAPAPAPTSQAETYIVGDALGWTVPPNTSVYQNWARNKKFKVGDTLVFNYVTGTHDVATVTKAAYDSCNSNTTLSKLTNPPTRITLTQPGEHYYFCTFPNHCSLGQKLAINVTGSSVTAPSPSPTTPSPTSPTATPPPTTTPSPTSPTATPPPTTTPSPPSPPNNSAQSLGAAGLFTTFLTIVVALFY